jgi:hypothetical protein
MAATISRRALVTATAASVVTPNVTRAKECPAAGMDWMAMSLEARNLAYNNGSMSELTTLGRKPKAGLQLRKRCASSIQNTSICLMLQESGLSGTCAAIARRIHAGQAQRFPDPPPLDRHGLPMAIWA